MAKVTKSESVNRSKSLLRNLDKNQLLELVSQQGFCQHCEALLEDRVMSLQTDKVNDLKSRDHEDASGSSDESDRTEQKNMISSQESVPTPAEAEPINFRTDEKRNSRRHSGSEVELLSLFDGGSISEERESVRASKMGWKDDFICIERIEGRPTNVVDGLELYTRVFDDGEQRKIVEFINKLQDKGREKQLRGRTYSEPKKWMRGKGRVTIQFGCCYNYAMDKQGNPPGIIRDAEVEPLPQLFKEMIKRMVRWRVMPTTCVPDSCIVNIYEEGDCIPPHIDHHDFDAPFYTVSLLSHTNILFGTDLRIVEAGKFNGPTSIHLPVGSVLIFNGNGANIAKHCISAVSAKRISITFRKMDSKKRPYNFEPDPEMQMIKPLVCVPGPIRSHVPRKVPQRKAQSDRHSLNKQSKFHTKKRNFHFENDEFHYVRGVRFRGDY